MTLHLLSFILFGEGFLTGLTLAAMLGPVTLTILRYGIQVNRAAGVWAAAGTWVSDFVFIGVTFWLTASIADWVEKPSVKIWIYIIGGCGLLVLGLLMTRVKSNSLSQGQMPTVESYSKAFAAGFLVNSMSPFTLFYWVGAAILLHLQTDPPFWYYLGVMLSLMMGDTIKAWLAPRITQWIREKYVYWVQVIAGIVIALTGMYMIGLGFFE